MRSVAVLSEETKPRSISAAHSIQVATSNALDRKHDGAAAKELDDGAGLAAFGGRQPRQA